MIYVSSSAATNAARSEASRVTESSRGDRSDSDVRLSQRHRRRLAVRCNREQCKASGRMASERSTGRLPSVGARVPLHAADGAAKRHVHGPWPSPRLVQALRAGRGGRHRPPCGLVTAYVAQDSDDHGMSSLDSSAYCTPRLNVSDSSARFCTCFMHGVDERRRHTPSRRPPHR